MQVIFKDFKKQTVSIEVELSDSVCIQTNKQKKYTRSTRKLF